jgi:hypothetical protein
MLNWPENYFLIVKSIISSLDKISFRGISLVNPARLLTEQQKKRDVANQFIFPPFVKILFFVCVNNSKSEGKIEENR